MFHFALSKASTMLEWDLIWASISWGPPQYVSEQAVAKSWRSVASSHSRQWCRGIRFVERKYDRDQAASVVKPTRRREDIPVSKADTAGCILSNGAHGVLRLMFWASVGRVPMSHEMQICLESLLCVTEYFN